MRRGVKAALCAAFAVFSVSATAAPPLGPDSQRPVPRYVSLAVESANGRHGPGLEHQIDWVYQRAGLPLKVTGESGPWRRVLDPDGAQVWIHSRNLAERRTAYVLTEVRLARAPRHDSGAAAMLEAGVVAPLTGCEGDWRRLAIGGRVGWLKKDALWGAEDCAGL